MGHSLSGLTHVYARTHAQTDAVNDNTLRPKLALGKNEQTALRDLHSLSGHTSYRKISSSLEASRFVFTLLQSLWNSTGPRQQRFRDARQISDRYDHYNIQSHHQPHDCLLIKAPRHWPLCGEFTGTGEFPAQRASYAENVSIWWRHHDSSPKTLF